jgi:small subunit ribosomal protein S23
MHPPSPKSLGIRSNLSRLSLSNNHIDRIPQRFSECTHLRYLNIRANNFAEFPKEVRPYTLRVPETPN